MTETSIGVTIPTLGTRPGWLEMTLSSVRASSTRPLELLVVAPSGATSVAAIAKRYGADVLWSDRKGLSAAVNDGWDALRRHKYLTWIGDDDLLARGALDTAASLLDRDPSASATFGHVRYIDARGHTLFVAHPGRLSATYTRWGKDLIPQPGSLFRRSAIRRRPWLDEQLSYAMDLDLFLYAMTVGHVRPLRREVACFRLHETSITGTNTGSAEATAVRIRYQAPAEARVVRAIGKRTLSLFDRLLYRALQRRDAVEASAYPSGAIL